METKSFKEYLKSRLTIQEIEEIEKLAADEVRTYDLICSKCLGSNETKEIYIPVSFLFKK